MTCVPEFCPTGELAPIPVSECCPRADQCSNTNCSEVRCLVERCPASQAIAPRPPGMCCPSLTQCPRDVTAAEDDVIAAPFTEAGDNTLADTSRNCSVVPCLAVTCEDGRPAPAPPGTCCPNITLCPARAR